MHSVVNKESLADDDGVLPVSVLAVLELTWPSRTCSTKPDYYEISAGKMKCGLYLIEQGDERRVFLPERLRLQALSYKDHFIRHRPKPALAP